MSEERDERRTVLIAAFEGWNDAGQAATNVVRHLVERYDAREIRHIACDGYYDYQVTRPMLCRVTGRPRLVWPQTTFYEIAVSPTHVIYAQIAPEPNYRWREYCRQSLRIADELDVDHVVTLGSMFASCPHTRPLTVDVAYDLDSGRRGCADAEDETLPAPSSASQAPEGTGTPEAFTSVDECDAWFDSALRQDESEGYSGPVGIPTVLDDMAREQSFETTSMWGYVPHYLGSDDCPKATLAMLRRLGRELGVAFDEGDLPRRVERWERHIAALMAHGPLDEYVGRLEERWDAADEARRLNEAAAGAKGAQAEQLVREAEDFLKNL